MVLNLIFLLFLGYIVVNIDSDSDNRSDDGDELLSEYFGSDTISDRSSEGDFTVDSELEDSDDNFEEQSLHDNLLNFLLC